jgi:hypothetical protein
VTSIRSSAPSSVVFDRAVASVRAAQVRPEVVLTEIPPPRRVAPFAHAVEGHVDLVAVRAAADDDLDEPEEAGGRFVLLHDPAAPQAWGGDLRVIALVKACRRARAGRGPDARRGGLGLARGVAGRA